MRFVPHVLMILMLMGCDRSQPAFSVPSATQPVVRYLALGDSYSIGESVPEADRWPEQLARLLRARGVNVDRPQIIATTGWTTDELSAGIDSAKPAGPFGLVSLLIGVNNQYRGRPVDAFRPEFAALLERSIAFAGGEPARVFVVSIPDWGVTPFAEGRDRRQIGSEIDAYNQVCREEAERRGVRFIDITPISRSTDGGSVAEDGLHPDGKQYGLWAARVAEQLSAEQAAGR